MEFDTRYKHCSCSVTYDCIHDIVEGLSCSTRFTTTSTSWKNPSITGLTFGGRVRIEDIRNEVFVRVTNDERRRLLRAITQLEKDAFNAGLLLKQVSYKKS